MENIDIKKFGELSPEALKTLTYILEKNEQDNYQDDVIDNVDNNESFIEDKEVETTIQNKNGITEEKNNIDGDDDIFIIYNDKTDAFSCDLAVEGLNIEDCEVRLCLETQELNLYYKGKIDKNGACLVEIKKNNILQEGKKGKIKLEIIADDNIFIPFETDFLIKRSKKVSISNISESKENKKKVLLKRTSITSK